MSIYPIVTEQELINLGKLVEQQKYQTSVRTKIKNLIRTQDQKLAESLSLRAKKLTEIDDSIQKL